MAAAGEADRKNSIQVSRTLARQFLIAICACFVCEFAIAASRICRINSLQRV
jgi:hypothetical protein